METTQKIDVSDLRPIIMKCISEILAIVTFAFLFAFLAGLIVGQLITAFIKFHFGKERYLSYIADTWPTTPLIGIIIVTVLIAVAIAIMVNRLLLKIKKDVETLTIEVVDVVIEDLSQDEDIVLFGSYIHRN